jgi:hypothetical protein
MEYATDVRDAQNDALESTIGTAPTLSVFNGSKPANCAAADAGTLLALGTLPSDWLAGSSSGVKAKAGTWTLTGQPGAGAGTAGTYWRIKVGATCKMQGTFGVGQEMVPDNNSIANGQTVTITTFSVTRGNA